MQVVEEKQASLFSFRLPAKPRYPKLSFTKQDLIETLIMEPSSAESIANDLGWEYLDVIEAIRELRDLGLVAPSHGCLDGDLDCPNCDLSPEPDSGLVAGDECPDCESDRLVDSCRWAYCGGKVSDFFLYTQTKGMRDGIQS